MAFPGRASSVQRACYVLPGYGDDPCLPPDDAIVPWLSTPKDCEAHVSDGPFLDVRTDTRKCCYAITCAPIP
jgi:hypothetical protein